MPVNWYSRLFGFDLDAGPPEGRRGRDVSPVEDIGSLRFVTFRDPDGNLLMLLSTNEQHPG
jgi:hypothetical protein